MGPNSVGISDRGDMEIIAINLNESLNIIPDNIRLESIHLGIILEYVMEEANLLEDSQPQQVTYRTEQHTSSVSEVVSKGRRILRLEEDPVLFPTWQAAQALKAMLKTCLRSSGSQISEAKTSMTFSLSTSEEPKAEMIEEVVCGLYFPLGTTS